MTADQWTRLAELIPDVMARPAEEREDFLQRACTGASGVTDDAMLREARALLRAAETAESTDAFASPLVGIASGGFSEQRPFRGS